MARSILLTVVCGFLAVPCADAGGELGPRLLSLRESVPDRNTPPPPVAFPTTRNMVNLVERNLPTSWSTEEGKLKNIKWVADLGGKSLGQPIVANGRVFVTKSDWKMNVGKAVLMALRETNGEILWRNSHDLPKNYWPAYGMPSAPAVVGDEIYYLVPGGDVICAQAATGKVAWRYDMPKELKVSVGFGYGALFCIQRPPLASPLVVGDLVFVMTGNGANEDGELVSPGAPSFIALHRKTGKLVWQSNLPGANVIDCQWSSPTFAVVNNTPQVIFAGGDAVIYGFEPATGKLLWKCDCLPTRKKRGNHSRDMEPYFVAAPVVHGRRLYIGLGFAPESAGAWSKTGCYFLCLDITKRGDVALQSYAAKSENNRDSALVWAFGGPIVPEPAKGRNFRFGPTFATAAVHDGLVYISEQHGFLHCLDAQTGQRYWWHDFQAAIWGSPYWADGKVFIGTDDGQVCVFAHGKSKKLISSNEMDEFYLSTVAAANGTLFVAASKLYAIGPK
jgi:outer membrane protein assembly factor BamB